MARKRSHVEELFELQLAMSDIPFPYEKEYSFHPLRKWRFDFIFRLDKAKLAIELEGGTWNESRHTTGKGFADDCEKYNEAALNGWYIMRFTSDMVKKGVAIKFVQRFFNTAF